MRRLSLFAAIVLAPLALGQRAPKPLVIVSWDGAADWVVDRMLSEGKLRNVAKLANTGVRAEFSTPPFPSKTAVSHVSIFTGTSPTKNGVTGNSVPLLPRADHTILESRSGFDANSNQAEPLWVTASRAGKKVLVLSAAGSYPPSVDLARFPKSNFVEFSGFESESVIAPARVFRASDLRPDKTVTFTVGEQAFLARLIDDPRDPVRGYDTVQITGPGTAPTYNLKPVPAAQNTGAWSGPTKVTKGKLSANVYFRLFSLDPDGSDFLLYQRKTTALQGTENEQETWKYTAAYGGFHDDPFFDVYQRGNLGTPIYKGGEGAAERRLLEIVRLDMQFLKNSFRFGLERYKPDLIFHYSPMIDSAGHTWMGVLDPESPVYNAGTAAKLLPYYEEVLELQDEWLGYMVDTAGQGAGFCLVSDHGMQGAGNYFNVNAVLENAGLLKRASDGKIDLSATKVCAPPWGDFFLVVNSTEWKAGIVPPGEKAQVLAKATRALLDARDPTTGEPIVIKIFRPEEVAGMGIGGPAGGDLYLDFARGYYPSSRLNKAIVSPMDAAIGQGTHGYWPGRRSMQAIFYISGPGVEKGLAIPGIRTIDIAPTICRLLGIPLPASMEGHVIGGVFKR